MAYEIPPLKTIADALEDEDYVCEFMPANDARPLDLILVSIGEDPEEPYLVEITFPADLDLALGQMEPYQDYYILQFLLRYRFSFDPKYAAPLALFLTALNRLVPAGAFSLDEDTGTIFLQYALYLPTREVDQDVLGEILSSFDTFAPSCGPLIQEVGGGQLDHKAAIARLEQQGIVLPPMLPGPASLIEPPAE